MTIEFLGTGTSTGVPQIGCNCEVCKSDDLKDRRLRTSALVSVDGINLLLDCGPDFREQILRSENKNIDALLVTHSHYDHVGGVDDLRPYCAKSKGGAFPIYARLDVLNDLRNRLPYCFKEHPYPGVPKFALHEIKNEPFSIKGVTIIPLPVMHAKLLINGYRINNMAYITDAKTISEETLDKIKGVDTLIINSLRIKPHMSHMCLEETLDVINKVVPRVAYLIHMSHDMGLHKQVSERLPKNVHLAYDGMIIAL